MKNIKNHEKIMEQLFREDPEFMISLLKKASEQKMKADKFFAIEVGKIAFDETIKEYSGINGCLKYGV